LTNFNKDHYVGEFKNGSYEGQGKMTYASGDVYDGQWKNNHQNGQGTYYCLASTLFKGDKFEGTWQNDKLVGNDFHTLINKTKLSFMHSTSIMGTIFKLVVFS
jgi:hypothetical protein